MYDNANPARQALAAVAGKLNAARSSRGPFRSGTQVRANAHEAALDGAADVRNRIRIALIASEVCSKREPEAVHRLADELAAPMDLRLCRPIHRGGLAALTGTAYPTSLRF